MSVVHSRVPSAYKPFRDRHVKTLLVPCPVCDALPDEGCVTVAGNATGVEPGLPTSHCHPGRRRMAIRAENARRLAERDPSPKEPLP